MKNFNLCILLLLGGVVFAQTNKTDGTGSLIMNSLVLAANSNTSFGTTTTFYNPKPGVDGSVYLFKDWSNKAIIYAGKRNFSVPNMNLNLERNTLESKFGKDSLFTFNFNNIDRFVINAKTYKNHYYDGENRVYQEIYNGNGIELLKGTRVKLIKASTNPMLNRSRDKYVQKEFYCLKKNNVIESIRLRKKDLLKYIDDKSQVDKILAYAKKQ